MSRHRQQIDLHRLDIHRDLAHALGTIDMEEDLAGAAQLTDGGDILDNADLVVDVHQADQNGVIAQRRLQLLQADQTVGLRIQVGDLEALALQMAARVQHRLVFGLAGDDVLALLLVEVGNPLDGQVVGLGRPGGKDNLPRIGTDQIGDVVARLIDHLFGLPAKAVGARSRVAKDAIQGQALHHFLGNTGIHRRGGGIIQINRQLHSSNTSRYGRNHHQTARTLTVTGSTSSLWPWGPPTCFCLSCRCAICLISA